MLKWNRVLATSLIIIEFMVLFYCFLSNYNPILPLYQFFYTDLDKLEVHFQQTTGATHYLKEDKDIDVLKNLKNKKFPNENMSDTDIDLVGNTSFNYIEESLSGDKITLVYGKLIGVADEDGKVPVFKVYYYKPINYMFNGIAPNIILIYQFVILYFIFSKCVSYIKIKKQI